MSTKRIGKIPPAQPGTCRGGCGRPIGKGRRAWCGERACIERANIISSPSSARWHVQQRDHGICAHCGFDALKAERIRGRFFETRYSNPEVYRLFNDIIRVLHTAWGVPTWIERAHLWEADHVTPVVEGGGECGIENYRTLCVPCHRRETKALAARRAQARRTVKAQERLDRWLGQPASFPAVPNRPDNPRPSTREAESSSCSDLHQP
jgi:5-methylcytosine-specific restriction enzyme A